MSLHKISDLEHLDIYSQLSNVLSLEKFIMITNLN